MIFELRYHQAAFLPWLGLFNFYKAQVNIASNTFFISAGFGPFVYFVFCKIGCNNFAVSSHMDLIELFIFVLVAHAEETYFKL
jgi:hypothetical protein